MFSSLVDRAMYRPLVLVSYAFNYSLGEYGLMGYHLLNLSLHLLCTFCVYALCRTLGAGALCSAAAALLFGLHPVNAEVVNYVSSRSESLATLFYLSSLVAYVTWRRSEGPVALILASGIFFVAGMLSKSTVITLPVAILVYDLLHLEGAQAPGTSVRQFELGLTIRRFALFYARDRQRGPSKRRD